jgi:hypothetical protein
MANSRETTPTKFTFDDCHTHTAQCDCYKSFLLGNSLQLLPKPVQIYIQSREFELGVVGIL